MDSTDRNDGTYAVSASSAHTDALGLGAKNPLFLASPEGSTRQSSALPFWSSRKKSVPSAVAHTEVTSPEASNSSLRSAAPSHVAT